MPCLQNRIKIFFKKIIIGEGYFIKLVLGEGYSAKFLFNPLQLISNFGFGVLGLRSSGYGGGFWLKHHVFCFIGFYGASKAYFSSQLSFLKMLRDQFWGWFFVTIGSVFFLGFFYAAIVSKFLPPSNNDIISAIQRDWYYCFLVPLTLPVLVVAVYFHWLSMKMFKHA